LFSKPNKCFQYTWYTRCTWETCYALKQHVGFTLDSRLLSEIEALRGREKRSTFIEHLIRLGLKAYKETEG